MASHIIMQAQMEESTTQFGRPVSRIQPGTNFSYPRPDSHPISHESADSRSSVNSNGSLPGMTDSSDSDVSVEDDFHYNSSASELWDSFWPSGTERSHRTRKSQTPNTPSRDLFALESYLTPQRTQDLEDDTVTVTHSDQDSCDSKASSQRSPSKTTSQRPKLPSARNMAKYSVYPKPTPLPTRITQLPPRISSLAPEPLLRPTNGSKPNTHLRTRASTHGLYLAPPPAAYTTTMTGAQSAQAHSKTSGSPNKLRSSASAYNMRDSRHNVTAPLVPVPAIPDQLRSAPPQIEHFVSVFDFDSDDESISEHDNFAKRIARGLHHKKSLKELAPRKPDGLSLRGHKKSASEKSALHPDKKPAASDHEGFGSITRKRGGSLGWMLGFSKNNK